MCTGDPPGKALQFAAIYGTIAVALGVGAWFAAGAARVALVVVAALFAAAALWIPLVVGLITTVTRPFRSDSRRPETD